MSTEHCSITGTQQGNVDHAGEVVVVSQREFDWTLELVDALA